MVLQDFRYAWRMLRQHAVVTATIVITLGLGIGANTAIFTVIHALLLRELPVKDPGQLVELLGTYPGDPRMNYFGWTVYEHYRDRNHVFSVGPAYPRRGSGQPSQAEGHIRAILLTEKAVHPAYRPCHRRILVERRR